MKSTSLDFSEPITASHSNTQETSIGENIEKTSTRENIEETYTGENIEETSTGENIEETYTGENIEETSTEENIEETSIEENIDENLDVDLADLYSQCHVQSTSATGKRKGGSLKMTKVQTDYFTLLFCYII